MAGNFSNQMGYNQMAGNNPVQFPYNNSNNLMYGLEQYRVNNQQPQLQFNNQFLKCRPVSSREEAMAFQIDLDGSLWVFPNIGNGKIYTKQVNNDGTATFSTYTFTENENPYNSNQYVTKNEFNKVVQTIMAAIGGNSMQPAQSNNQVNSVKDNNLTF